MAAYRPAELVDYDDEKLEFPLDTALKNTLHASGQRDEPIVGNIYRYFALMPFGHSKYTGQLGTLFSPPEGCFNKCTTWTGICFIVLIQILAPLAIIVSSIKTIIPKVQPGAFKEYDFSQWVVALMAQAFIFCFILVCFRGVSDQLASSRKIARMLKGLAHMGAPTCMCWVMFDAFIHCYVSCVLSVAIFAVLYSEETGKGILMDSMSLGFLANIDDIASDFGFLGAAWDDNVVGEFYGNMARQGIFAAAGDPIDGDGMVGTTKNVTDLGDVDDARRVAEDTCVNVAYCLYMVTRVILGLCLLFAVPSIFIFSSSAKHVNYNVLATTTAAATAPTCGGLGQLPCR